MGVKCFWHFSCLFTRISSLSHVYRNTNNENELRSQSRLLIQDFMNVYESKEESLNSLVNLYKEIIHIKGIKFYKIVKFVGFLI